jgi:hypothetical protein
VKAVFALLALLACASPWRDDTRVEVVIDDSEHTIPDRGTLIIRLDVPVLDSFSITRLDLRAVVCHENYSDLQLSLEMDDRTVILVDNQGDEEINPFTGWLSTYGYYGGRGGVLLVRFVDQFETDLGLVEFIEVVVNYRREGR